jgi:diguanylate cyclase (GGDEF)-like protein
MSLLANISLKRALALLVFVVSVLAAGTGMTIKLTTEHLINDDAQTNARDWAIFLAANIPDLKQIAAGEAPSMSSMTFLDGARKYPQVLRYVIYNREGYSQLFADHKAIAIVDLSELSLEAAQAISTKQTVIDVSEGESANLPMFFARAFVPIIINGEPIGTVAAFVDETEQRASFHETFLIAAVLLCGLTALAFGVPAIGWYQRTKEKQQADRRIRYLAHHDVLTGLANRARLIERLDGALTALPSTGGRVAVHFVDIDRFKEVNDTHGHDGGDFLLSSIGCRLQTLTRTEDFVARLGGDEFVVVQSEISGKEQAEAFARRINEVLSEPIYFHEQQLNVNVTIGVALAPTDGNSSERLLKSADLALYNGKAAGRNCIRFFAPEMDVAMQSRLNLEKNIRDAIADKTFVLHYQPVFEMTGKRLVGYEALVRLPAKDGTLIPPATFIPVAEEMRVIDKIGAWVLREACKTAQTWPQPLTVAVNLSPAQFEGNVLKGIVADALRGSGLEAERLELEITESLLLGNSEETMAQLREIKALGVSIVMDDFGTGYSSLSYLWKFPFDKLKIDRSFMEGFSNSGRDAETVVKTIIALGRELKMRVTVEGVETATQADFLDNAAADQVQGFYFGRPVPASEVSADILADFRKRMPVRQTASLGRVRLVKSGTTD